MKSESFTIEKSKLAIDGYPDATKVVALSDEISKRLSDLTLHRNDLEFSQQALKKISGYPPEMSFENQAFWRVAIVHYFKCFGSGERFQLSENAILKSEPSEAKEVFSYFKTLRNKHFVHDENSYSQANACAILNDGTKSFKVERIVCTHLQGQTLDLESMVNMHKLVEVTLNWVVDEFNRLAEKLTIDLEKIPYDALCSYPDTTIRSPKVSEAFHSRKKS
jgi:hypothetical protein